MFWYQHDKFIVFIQSCSTLLTEEVIFFLWIIITWPGVATCRLINGSWNLPIQNFPNKMVEGEEMLILQGRPLQVLQEKQDWRFYHPQDICVKVWEPTVLIGAFGLSEELSTEVGFAFSDNGLKLIQRSTIWTGKKNVMIFFDDVSWFQICSWNSYHIFDIPLHKMSFFTQKIAILSKHYTMLTH